MKKFLIFLIVFLVMVFLAMFLWLSKAKSTVIAMGRISSVSAGNVFLDTGSGLQHIAISSKTKIMSSDNKELPAYYLSPDALAEIESTEYPYSKPVIDEIKIIKYAPLIVVNPSNDQVVGSSFNINVMAADSFDNVLVSLSDSYGNTFFSTDVDLSSLQSSNGYKSFDFPVKFDSPFENNSLQVSADKDGGSIYTYNIPLFTGSGQATTEGLFFGKAGDSTCSQVSPVERNIMRSPNVNAALTSIVRALILGPTNSEKGDGLVSYIPHDAKISSVLDTSGTATVDFENLNISGKCQIMGLEAELEATLKSIPEIQNVVVTSNGKALNS